MKSTKTLPNPADLLTPAILSAGPEVVALFITYVETANLNTISPRKANKAAVQAAYKAYDAAFTAAQKAAPAVTDAEVAALLTADAAAYDSFLSAVAASTPDPTPAADWLETAETDEDDSADLCDADDLPYFSSRY